MTVRMNAEQLDRELARRGWNASNLAAASGCSPATISGARRGRPISNATLSRIAAALRDAPVIPGIDELIGGGEPAANDQPRVRIAEGR